MTSILHRYDHPPRCLLEAIIFIAGFQSALSGSVAYLTLSNGQPALVDAEFAEVLSKVKWHAHRGRDGTVYARCNWRLSNPRRTRAASLHHVVTSSPKGVRQDHKNRNGLDNRRANLRNCTAQQNRWNAVGFGGSSQFKGVSWYKRNQKWGVNIRVDGKSRFLGLFSDEREAALAYNVAAVAAHGEFASLNPVVGES